MTTPEIPVILLAEDDDADVFLLQRAFERAGFAPRLLVEPDGQAALERLAREPRVDLLLTDLKMPRLSGLELLRRLKKDGLLDGLIAVVLSSSGEERDRDEALALGVTDYLRKPMSSEEWRPVIERLRALLRSAAKRS